MSTCGCSHKFCKHTPFVHLHLHTDFSLLDGASTSARHIKKAQEFNHPAITILDHGHMSGALTHFLKCKDAGIKPIFGMEAYLNDNLDKNLPKEEAESIDVSDKNTHQSIIVKNKKGYQNLNKLTYLSFTEGYYYKGRITTDWLMANKEGLIVTTSCMGSKFAKLIEAGKENEAEERIKYFLKEFGEDFYAELQFNEIPQQKIYNHFILKMIKKYDLQPILTGDVHYTLPEENRLQDVLIAINQGQQVGQAWSIPARHLGYASVEDLMNLNDKFGFNYPEKFLEKCIENTLKVSDKCNFTFETDVNQFPTYVPTPDVIEYFKVDSSKEIIYKLSHAKLRQKLNNYRKSGTIGEITPEVEKKYIDRLDFELKVIEEKGMLDYFLVVWELIKFCKENDIETGPGRGSAAGSLLSWCLDITKIDSIRFGLFFERFLNPERKGNPDIDIDFESGTDEITLEFLYKKYGKERVVPVITFNTFSEKSTIKDVARALGLNTGNDSDVAYVTKEMPDAPEWPKPMETLEKWIELWPTMPECSERVKTWLLDPANKEVLELSVKLQGQISHLGKHAAGIVITPGPVWESMPVNIVKKQIVSGFQESGKNKDLSEIGILKLDRLKLETLNVIKDALQFIGERHGEETKEKVQKDLDIDYLNFEDQNLYEELRLGNNQGIFQFESEGITSLVKGMQATKFDELVAANALYRPGPMKIKAHEDFIKNKMHPNERTYAHDSLIPLLEETNGVLIFQEQLMFIAEKIGGMTLGEGDNLRKVMDGGSEIIAKSLVGDELTEKELNNKNYKSYKQLWAKFIAGAKEKGLSEHDVADIESWLVKYLGYSFNKSHSVCYAVLALQTLYLKHYYPTEFYCALLNHPKKGSGKDAKEKEKRWLTSAIMAAMAKGIEISNPNRKSNWEWTILDDKKIAMGFSNISGMGQIGYNELKAMNFGSMSRDTFFSHKWKKFNKTCFEACVKAGLFDDWSNSREEIINLRNTKIKDVHQYDLFTGEVGIASVMQLKKYKHTPEDQKYKEFVEVCNLDIKLLKKIANMKEMFLEKTGATIDAVTNFEDPGKYYYFILDGVDSRTSPKGHKYYSILVSDGAIQKRINMWAPLYDKVKQVLSPGSFYVTKFMKAKGFLSFNAAAHFRKVM